MIKFINSLLEASRHFGIADFAAFKICLVSIGLLLGIYFQDFFLGHTWIVWVIAAVSYIFIMVQTVRYYRQQSRKRAGLGREMGSKEWIAGEK